MFFSNSIFSNVITNCFYLNWIELFLNKIYKKIGIKYSGAHILRHTFAKSMIAKDVNIVTVKELLGHASIQTTMIYTNPNQKEVQKAYLNAIKYL